MSLKHKSVEEKVKNFSQDAEKKEVDDNDEINDRAREHWTFARLIFLPVSPSRVEGECPGRRAGCDAKHQQKLREQVSGKQEIQVFLHLTTMCVPYLKKKGTASVGGGEIDQRKGRGSNDSPGMWKQRTPSKNKRHWGFVWRGCPVRRNFLNS